MLKHCCIINAQIIICLPDQTICFLFDYNKALNVCVCVCVRWMAQIRMFYDFVCTWLNFFLDLKSLIRNYFTTVNNSFFRRKQFGRPQRQLWSGSSCFGRFVVRPRLSSNGRTHGHVTPAKSDWRGHGRVSLSSGFSKSKNAQFQCLPQSYR